MRINELQVPQIEMTFEPEEAQVFMRMLNSISYPDVEGKITEKEYLLLNNAWYEMWEVLDRLGIDKDVYFGDEYS